MGPQNGIVGNGDPFAALGMMPQEQAPDDSQIKEAQKKARFSKTAEFKQMKEKMQERIAFYQQYLPDGRNVIGTSDKDFIELGRMWLTANTIIGECRSFLQEYEDAERLLKEYKDATAGRAGA